MPADGGPSYYEFLPLPDYKGTVFRVLELLPGRLCQPLKGNLVLNTLVRAPLTVELGLDYEALSSCWGADTRERWIEVEGKVMHITLSLYDALQHLRFETETRGSLG